MSFSTFHAAPLALRALLASCALLFAVTATAQDKVTLVWSSFDGKINEILLAEGDGEAWREPERVYHSENAIASPSVATLDDGSTVIVWSEQQRLKSVLKWTQRALDSQAWTEPTVFSRLGKENVAPTLLSDPSGALWVFWSAQVSDYTDVYFKRQRAGTWSQAQAVHPSNKVPDIKPRARITQQAEIEIAWNTYDFDLGRYVETSRLFALEESLNDAFTDPRGDSAVGSQTASGGARSNDRPTEVDLSQVPLPPYFPSQAFGYLHAPSNVFQQAHRIEPRSAL